MIPPPPMQWLRPTDSRRTTERGYGPLLLGVRHESLGAAHPQKSFVVARASVQSALILFSPPFLVPVRCSRGSGALNQNAAPRRRFSRSLTPLNVVETRCAAHGSASCAGNPAHSVRSPFQIRDPSAPSDKKSLETSTTDSSPDQTPNPRNAGRIRSCSR